jgi:hypothetical protein
MDDAVGLFFPSGLTYDFPFADEAHNSPLDLVATQLRKSGSRVVLSWEFAEATIVLLWYFFVVPEPKGLILHVGLPIVVGYRTVEEMSVQGLVESCGQISMMG